MNILLLDNHTSYLSELQLILQKFAKIETVTSIPTNTTNYDLIVLSGGNQYSLANHPDKYQEQLLFVKNSLQPMVGICLGAQIIAYAYGSKVEHLDSAKKGLIEIHKKFDHSIFQNITQIQVYESHKWAITKLSDQLINLADSDSGVEIFRHKNKPQFGFQFHPEIFTDKSSGDEILSNLIRNSLFINKNP